MRNAAAKNPQKSNDKRATNAKGFRHPLRAALYARISTADQQTLAMQTTALRKYARERGWLVTLEVKEVGSGAKRRPKREEILKVARQRQVDVILVWKLDRWGRSLADLAASLVEMNELGVAFVSLTEALDLTTASGRAMAGLLAVFAEFEREVLRERILAGMAEARRKGTRIGRPFSVKGHAAKIRRLRAAGATISAIARELRIARSSVRVYLT